MQIRLVRDADAEAVNELLDQLGYAQNDRPGGDGGPDPGPGADDPACAAYVADADGDVLGVVAVQVCPFFERGGLLGPTRGPGRLRSGTPAGRRWPTRRGRRIVRREPRLRADGGHQRGPPPTRRTRVLPEPRLHQPDQDGRPASCATYSPATASAGRKPNPDRHVPVLRCRGGQSHRDAQPAGGAGREGEGSVVCPGDALDDGQAEADTRVVGADACRCRAGTVR